MKYSTNSFPPDDHILITQDGPDALTLFLDNQGLSIVRWYSLMDANGNYTDSWRVDPSSGMTLTKKEIGTFMQVMYENRAKFK